MMRFIGYLSLILFMAALSFPADKALCKEGGASLKLGYISLDEEGSLSVNRETYNLYEGLSVSLENLSYLADNGVNLTANLKNVSLDNRNINISTFKPRLFSLSVHDDKYRRIYDSQGGLRTIRETIGGRASVSFSKYVTLFGSFNRVDKEGEDVTIFQEPSDPLILTTDYIHQSFSIGGKAYNKNAGLRAEYRTSDFNDYAHENSDRKSNSLRLDASVTIPFLERTVLAGGFYRRIDKLNLGSVELRTNQGWGAVRVWLPMAFSINYRLVFARTLRTSDDVETDNALNTLAVGKTWRHRGGLRIGYENRIADDLVDRSQSHGLLVSGWMNVKKRLYLKASGMVRNKDIVTGTTLLGDEDYSRYLASARYLDNRWGYFSIRYQGKVKENPDIGSRVDYTSFSTSLRLNRRKMAKLTLVYSYYEGEFENRSTDYRFADHVITGTITPVSFNSLDLTTGGTYYRGSKDQDIEKFSINVMIGWTLPEDFRVEAGYKVFNYDNFLVSDDFYTGNVYELNIVKKLNI